jgi:hypothetical protein
MIPIRNWICSQVDVIIKGRRSIDDNRASDSIRVLGAEVRVVPNSYVRQSVARDGKERAHQEVPYCWAKKV